MLVDTHALVDGESGLFRKRNSRAHADADHDDIGIDRPAVFEDDAFSLDCGDTVLQMKIDAMLFVQGTDEIAQLRPEHPFKRSLLRCDDMHFDIARSQRSGRLKANEARADDDHALRRLCLLDERTAIRERPQGVHMRLIYARNVEPDWLGTGCEQ